MAHTNEYFLLIVSSAIIFGGLSFIVNLTLSILLFCKSQKDRGRLIFASFTLYYAFCSAYYLFRNGQTHIDNGDPFSFVVLASGAFVIVLFLVFPLEVLLPPQLHKRWFVLIFLIPVLLMDIIWVVLVNSGMRVARLSNAHAILSELNDASVILRVVFFCFVVLFFLSSLFFMVWAHKRYMTDRVLRIYAYATIPVMMTFILIVIYGLSSMLYTISMSYICFFNASISYLLLSSGNSIEKGKNTQLVESGIKEDMTVSNEMKEYELHLLHQLDKLMETQKLYCSSDLSLPELARMLGTNRTKLSEIIRFKGYTNFSAYLNSYRLEEFMCIMSVNGADNISDAASQAGFGSKASLYRCFISAHGVSPSEYLKKHQLK